MHQLEEILKQPLKGNSWQTVAKLLYDPLTLSEKPKGPLLDTVLRKFHPLCIIINYVCGLHLKCFGKWQ